MWKFIVLYKGGIVGLLFIFLILGSQSAFAQWNKKYIMGPVMNSVTGAPIMGVEVDFYSMDGKKVLSQKKQCGANIMKWFILLIW